MESQAYLLAKQFGRLGLISIYYFYHLGLSTQASLSFVIIEFAFLMMFCIVAYSNKSYLTRPTYYFKYLQGLWSFCIACYVKRRVQFYKQPMKLLNTIKTTDQSTISLKQIGLLLSMLLLRVLIAINNHNEAWLVLSFS